MNVFLRNFAWNSPILSKKWAILFLDRAFVVWYSKKELKNVPKRNLKCFLKHILEKNKKRR